MRLIKIILDDMLTIRKEKLIARSEEGNNSNKVRELTYKLKRLQEELSITRIAKDTKKFATQRSKLKLVQDRNEKGQYIKES